MKETKFSEEQIVKILRAAERGEQTIAAVCRTHGVHETTFYKWRRHFGGMEAITPNACVSWDRKMRASSVC